MKIVRASQYTAHLSANCKEHFHQVIDSPSKITIQDVLTKPITSPTTPAEIKATWHLVRRIMQQNSGCSGNQAVVKIPTRGQVTPHSCTHKFCNLVSHLFSPSPWYHSLDAVFEVVRLVSEHESVAVMRSAEYAL